MLHVCLSCSRPEFPSSDPSRFVFHVLLRVRCNFRCRSANIWRRSQLTGLVQPGPGGCTGGAFSHSSRWDIVCTVPQLPVSSVWWFHAFISALHLPCYTRGLLRVFQVSHGKSCPLARHSVGVIPLSIQSWARMLSWFHLSFQMLVLAISLVVWRGGTVCRKLALDFSRGGGAVCPCRGCLVSNSCALRLPWATMDRLMWGGNAS